MKKKITEAAAFMVFMVAFIVGTFAQNNGLTPTSDRGRQMPSKSLRKSIGTLKLLITDATSEVKYWNKDTVFTNFWKINVDSIINNYNDTVNKSGTPCVDSLWKVANTIYHRDNNCGVQNLTIAPLCTDSVWKISTTIYHRSITCEVEFWESGEGCSGGDVYYTASLGDSLGLDPVPECGDVLVVTQDTCRKYVYSRGATPVKWNFIGAFLDNENCFDFPVCVDSFWRSGNLIYHRNIDCIVQSVVDSNTAEYKFRQDGTGVAVLKDTLGRIIKYHAVKGAGNITVAKVGDDIVVSDSTGIGYIFTNVGSYAFVLKDTLTRNIKFRSIRGLGCIKAVVNGNNIEISDTCAVVPSDYKFTNVGGQKEVLKDTLNRLIKYRTFQGVGGVKVTQNTNTISIEDTTNVTDYRFANVGTGKQVLKDTLSRLIKYRTLLGAGSTKVTEGTNEITIQDTISNVLNTAGVTGGSGVGYFKTSLTPSPAGGSIRLTAGTNTKITQSVNGLDGQYSIEALPTPDTITAITSNSSTFTFHHRSDATNYLTANAGAGIVFTNTSTGRLGAFTINADTSSTIFNGIGMQLVTTTLSATNNAKVSLTPQLFPSGINIAGGGINVVTSSTGTNGTITITGTEVDGDITNELQRLSVGGSVGNVTVSVLPLGNAINLVSAGKAVFTPTTPGLAGTITLTVASDTVCTSQPTVNAYDLDLVTGNGYGANCLKIDRCNWDLQSLGGSGTLRFVVVANNDGLGLNDCVYEQQCNCSLAFQSIDDPNKLLVSDGADIQGLFLSMIDVINRQGQRIAQLEGQKSAGAILASNRQQATIDTLLKRIEALEGRTTATASR